MRKSNFIKPKCTVYVVKQRKKQTDEVCEWSNNQYRPLRWFIINTSCHNQISNMPGNNVFRKRQIFNEKQLRIIITLSFKHYSSVNKVVLFEATFLHIFLSP